VREPHDGLGGLGEEFPAVLDAARSGDEAAFARIYREVQPPLQRYAAGLVGREAQDVTAEAWLQIARDLRGFAGDLDAFRGWTARIVRNRAMDLLRLQARRPALPVGLPFDEIDAFDASDSQDAWDGVVERMSTDRAIALIAELPRDQAEAVLLRVVVGLDAATAGEVLGKRAGAVRVAAHRGLKTLARRLAGPAERTGVTRGPGSDAEGVL
jgi:RNA polymerase sigma-70 factor (ECF subfamily)